MFRRWGKQSSEAQLFSLLLMEQYGSVRAFERCGNNRYQYTVWSSSDIFLGRAHSILAVCSFAISSSYIEQFLSVYSWQGKRIPSREYVGGKLERR